MPNTLVPNFPSDHWLRSLRCLLMPPFTETSQSMSPKSSLSLTVTRWCYHGDQIIPSFLWPLLTSLSGTPSATTDNKMGEWVCASCRMTHLCHVCMPVAQAVKIQFSPVSSKTQREWISDLSSDFPTFFFTGEETLKFSNGPMGVSHAVTCISFEAEANAVNTRWKGME